MKYNSGVVKSWSKDQKVHSLSSAEAELYAANYAAQQMLGLRTLLRELGMEVKSNLIVYTSANIGIVSRRGIGKVRHIEVNDLWLQKKVLEGQIKVKKIGGKFNPADLGTKPLDSKTIEFFMSMMKFEAA